MEGDYMENSILEKFGFKFNKRSVHTGRTIMLEELSKLIEAVPDAINYDKYVEAIIDQNCLLKRSSSSRKITASFLTELYSLDPTLSIFRTLLFFWNRDEEARPLLAMLCAVCRDRVLNHSFKEIRSLELNTEVQKKAIEELIDDMEPNRFSESTLQSMARNILSSWTKSGHLKGRREKVRAQAKATPSTVAYAIYLGYLAGERGPALFETKYMEINDCSKEMAIELAENASARGWINYKRIGNVMEISLPNLITKEEAEIIYEQN